MRRALRIAGAVLLLAGLMETLRIGWADYLFHRDTIDSVRQAEAIWPNDARFEARLADLDPPNAIGHLRHAVALDPGLSKSWIQLGLQLELAGHAEEAERCFLEAARRDHQFLPAWTLANFYVRRDDPQHFWPWARKAIEMSYEDVAPLLRLAFVFTDDPTVVLDKCIVHRRKVEREFFYYLINQKMDATCIAARLMENPTKDDVRPLLVWTDHLITTQQLEDARRVWNALSNHRLIDYPYAEGITNPDFAHSPLQSGFDWRIEPPQGISVTAGSGALRIEFSGRQPETAEIVSQFLGAGPGKYLLTFEYRTSGISASTGLRWWVADADSESFPAAEAWRTSSWEFSGTATNRLILLEQRDRGTARPEGVVYLRGLRLEKSTNE